MSTVVVQAVERAIAVMRRDLGETLSMDDLARSAMFSKFHFTRVFQRVTGVSPGRYLSAVRIEEAKRLLVSTSSSVADISYQVGYNSVGSFSARFHESVGVPPSVYRRDRGLGSAGGKYQGAAGRVRSVTIRGTVLDPGRAMPGSVLVGLFGSRILEGDPVRFTVLGEPGPYTIEAAPAGTWYVLAHSLPATDGAGPVAVGAEGPITLLPHAPARVVDISLRPRYAFDPPVLTTLLEWPFVTTNPAA